MTSGASEKRQGSQRRQVQYERGQRGQNIGCTTSAASILAVMRWDFDALHLKDFPYSMA